MLTPPTGLTIYVATQPVDFRKGADGLALLAKETLDQDPNGRPYQLVVKDKAPLAVAWGDAILRPNRWVIPKGAKHHHNAMKLIAWMQDAHRQAEAAKLSGCAGGNNNVAALLPAEVQDYLATSPEHLKMSLVSNDDWWGQNGPAAYKRFTGWVIGK